MRVLRITGIASGLDTEQVVRDLMRIERLKVERLYQERQTIQWRKEQFREIINRVRSFRDTYFNILKPETNLMSASALHKMQVSSSDNGILTAVASSGALSGTRTVEILQLATEAKGTSTAPVTATIQSSADITEPVTVTEGKNVIRASLNGQTKEITVAEGTYTLDEVKSELQAKIDSAFGTGKIDVSSSGNRLQFAVSPLDTLSLSSNTY